MKVWSALVEANPLFGLNLPSWVNKGFTGEGLSWPTRLAEAFPGQRKKIFPCPKALVILVHVPPVAEPQNAVLQVEYAPTGGHLKAGKDCLLVHSKCHLKLLEELWNHLKTRSVLKGLLEALESLLCVASMALQRPLVMFMGSLWFKSLEGLLKAL